jgi:hypothetical protein
MGDKNNKPYEVIADSMDLSKVKKGYLLFKGSGRPDEHHEIIGIMLDDGTQIGDMEQITKVEEHVIDAEKGIVLINDVTNEKLLHTGELLF